MSIWHLKLSNLLTTTRKNFQNRQEILEAGFYQAILEAVSDLLSNSKNAKTILDIGCGEGSILANSKKVILTKPSMP